MHSFLLLPATQRFLSTQKKPGTALIIFSVKHFGGYFLFVPKPGMQLRNERSFWCEIIGLKIQKGSNGIHLSHVPPTSQPRQVRAQWVVREGKRLFLFLQIRMAPPLPLRMHFPACHLGSSTNLGNSRYRCTPETSGKHPEISFQHSNECPKGWESRKNGARLVHGPVPPLQSNAGTPRGFL